MSKSSTERLQKKYGGFRNYSELAEKIIADNHNRVATKISRLNNSVFTEENAKIKNKAKAINLPEMVDILPKRVEAIKSKDKGRWMADRLKRKITDDLRSVLEQPGYMKTRGKVTGTLKDQAIKDFQDKIRQTFENYTKIDPTMGVPPNIRNIAVTEVRSVVNNTKEAYMNELLKRNSDLYIEKTFVHNNRASKNPRMHHKAANGMTVMKSQPFVLYDKEKGRTIVMMYPHDPNLSPEETIGCSCEVVYSVQRMSSVQRWNYRKEGD